MAASPERVRHNRMMSFGSNKSNKSGGSKQKIDLTETHRDKEANRMHTHADPTRAMNELQPSAIALQKSNLESLRSIQHKDRYGNVITEPDLSNPTRHRFERPLDTIRSFEAAVDGTYNSRRASIAGNDSVNGHSRPTSFFGDPRGNLTYPVQRFNDQSNYYNNNNRGFMPKQDNYGEPYGGFNVNSYYGDNQASRPQRNGARPPNDPWAAQSPNGYAPNGQYQNDNGSASGSGNHSMDQLAQSTDPSSLSSSRDGLQLQQQQQQQQQRKPEPQMGEAYGFTGFAANSQLDTQPPFQSMSQDSGPSGTAAGLRKAVPNGQAVAAAPPPPVKDVMPQVSAVPTRKPSLLQQAKSKKWFKRMSKS